MICAFIFLLLAIALPVHAEILCEWDFETGAPGWSIENGIWEIGTPINVGPESCRDSTQCAGTVLDGDYEPYTDSRLITPSCDLRELEAGEEAHLRFWQWFSYSSYDAGYIQISIFDPTLGWSEWINIGNTIVDTSPLWSLMDVDLTAYAGQTVRIAFHHTANRADDRYANEDSGWYIDDVTIVADLPDCRDLFDFEDGWGGWSADRGVWQVGEPTTGPETCYSGTQCAGTVLDGDYPPYTDSHLVSPSCRVPGESGEEAHLRFRQWFSFSTLSYNGVYYDPQEEGYIRISTRDDDTGEWSEWQSIGNTVDDTSPVWSLMDVDLTAYIGQTVRFAFYHTAHRADDRYANEDVGWYIDDVTLVAGLPDCRDLFDFEDGWGGWSADRGVWQVGEPAAGPETCYSGTQCAGTVLGGDYPPYTDSRLISPACRVPSTGALKKRVLLKFSQWFSYSSYDEGKAQIKVFDPTTSWSEWMNIGDSILDTYPGWSLMDIDLTAYADKTVRFAFYHTANRTDDRYADESIGWYLDNIRLDVFDSNTLYLECPSKQEMNEDVAQAFRLIATAPDQNSISLKSETVPDFCTFSDNGDGKGS
jgi:hypothetical protein